MSDIQPGDKKYTDTKLDTKTRHQKRKRNSRKSNHNPTEILSRALSWALRHQGPSIGLSMTPDGFVPVSQILASKHPKLSSSAWTLQDIREVVKASDKQRFQLDERPAENYPGVSQDSAEGNSVLCIRATQGHSLKFIDSDLLLVPIPSEELDTLPTIVHGTYQHMWTESISKQGLSRMNRNHIHFAAGLPDPKKGVISGMRKTCDVYIYVNTAKCAANPDIQFYRSANGVILTAGVKGEGILPMEYISHVSDPKGNLLLDQRTTS